MNQTSQETLKEYFKIWRDNLSYRKYADWCELHFDELQKQKEAYNNDVDSSYWFNNPIID